MLMRFGNEVRCTNIMEYAVVAQQVERILGKDEVVSSSLINSSISFFIKKNIVYILRYERRTRKVYFSEHEREAPVASPKKAFFIGVFYFKEKTS